MKRPGGSNEEGFKFQPSTRMQQNKTQATKSTSILGDKKNVRHEHFIRNGIPDH